MNGHEQSFSVRNVVVRTPENLEITYELAGAGTRISAYLIDALLMMIGTGMFQNLIVAILVPLANANPTYVVAAAGIVSFLVFNSYFILFELFWAGQSPGKRVVGIRVVKSGGYSLRLIDSALRNLLRAVDFLPVFYGIGLLSLLWTRQCQRLGDLVAGTLVVYQNPSQAADQSIFSTALEPGTELPHLQLAGIPADVIAVCDEFLRTRADMIAAFRLQVANDLVILIEQISGISPGIRQSDESFLMCAVTQYGRTPPEWQLDPL